MSYNAIILTQESQNKLLEYFADTIPKDWTVKAHHVTISMGNPPKEFEDLLDEKISITIKGYGKNDRAIATYVKINHETLQSKNKIPHITLAINSNEGATAKESNDIENWNPIDKTFTIEGIYKKSN